MDTKKLLIISLIVNLILIFVIAIMSIIFIGHIISDKKDIVVAEAEEDVVLDLPVFDNADNNQTTGVVNPDSMEASTDVEEPVFEPELPKKTVEPESEYNIYQQAIIDKHMEEIGMYSQPNSYDKTEAIYQKDKDILGCSFYDFTDNYLSFIGDSLVYGIGADVDENGVLLSFPERINQATTAFHVENMGIPGATIGSYVGDTSIINRIKDIPYESSVIVVMGGFNDFANYNDYIGNEEKVPGTYTGDLYASMSQLRDSYPDAEIFYVLTYRNAYENSENYPVAYALDSFLQYQRQYAEEFGFNIIDLHKSGYLDATDPQTREQLFYDDVHLNTEGYKKLGIHILANIIATLAEKGYTEF